MKVSQIIAVSLLVSWQFGCKARKDAEYTEPHQNSERQVQKAQPRENIRRNVAEDKGPGPVQGGSDKVAERNIVGKEAELIYVKDDSYFGLFSGSDDPEKENLMTTLVPALFVTAGIALGVGAHIVIKKTASGGIGTFKFPDIGSKFKSGKESVRKMIGSQVPLDGLSPKLKKTFGNGKLSLVGDSAAGRDVYLIADNDMLGGVFTELSGSYETVVRSSNGAKTLLEVRPMEKSTLTEN